MKTIAHVRYKLDTAFPDYISICDKHPKCISLPDLIEMTKDKDTLKLYPMSRKNYGSTKHLTLGTCITTSMRLISVRGAILLISRCTSTQSSPLY